MESNGIEPESTTQEIDSSSVDNNQSSQPVEDTPDSNLVLQEDISTSQTNEDVVEDQNDLEKALSSLAEDTVVAPTSEETLVEEVDKTAEEEIEQSNNDNLAELVQSDISSTNLIDKLEQLPDTYNVASTVDESIASMQTDSTIEPTDILQEAAKKIAPNKWKPKSGAFSLGVPGLSFSAQNLKIANDGTKMVQIHQSQITPSQLQALQANPNIKVVFRHIPSGKSFTKPPKNLFSNKKSLKRKSNDGNHETDDSVYNFDDFDDTSSRNLQAKIKTYNHEPAKFARYNPNVGFKRKQGRAKLQDSSLGADSMHSKPVLPAQIQLTDALVKLNKPGAEHTIKVHVKQVTHDILINMELNPKYNIVLTAKQDVAPEHSLEELVKEWEEKETLDQPKESVPEPSPSKPTPETGVVIKVEEPDINEVNEELQPMPEVEKPKAITPEKSKPKQDNIQVLKAKESQKQRKNEMEDIAISAAFFETTSRSGRKRKPTRHSLEIAKMVKRRAVVQDDEFDLPAPKKSKLSSMESKIDDKKKVRGRSRQNLSPSGSAFSEEDEIKKILRNSSPLRPEPRVMLSPADKRLADKLMFGDKVDLSIVKSEEPAVMEVAEATTEKQYKVTEEKSKATEEESKAMEEVSKATEEESKATEEESKATEEESKATKEESKATKEESKATEEESKATEEESKAAEEESKATEEESKATEEKSPTTEETKTAKGDAEKSTENQTDEQMDISSEEKLEKKEADAENQSETKEITAQETAMDTTSSEQSDKKDDDDKTEEKQESSNEELKDKSENNVESNINQDDKLSTEAPDVSESSKSEESTLEKTEDSADKIAEETSEAKVTASVPATSEESPSDILARKLSRENESPNSTNNQLEVADADKSPSNDEVEEEENVDNKYRLRKLLQQCSIDEIRSVALPKALEVISTGDFFIHKAGQMGNKKVSYTSLYNQLEDFYLYMAKESLRYSTLLKRANKVGGDRRMEKVILMPVYNKMAAESLAINSSSVDAHIGGIYQKPTSPMIAANSFHINCKMDLPVHRLKLPEISDKSYSRKKSNSTNFSTSTSISSQQAHLNALTAQRSYNVGRPRGSYKRGYQVRKPNYLLGEQAATDQTNLSLQEHARLQAASRFQSTLKPSVTASQPITTNFQATPKSDVTTEVKSVLNQPVTTETVQLSGAVASEIVAQEGTETDETAAIVSAEDGKQLVSIGDGQYVELPEGYTLIQTEDGYIIGQPGATFVQGEDGNVYMTNTEDGTELTDQVLTTTADITAPATQPEETGIQQLNQS